MNISPHLYRILPHRCMLCQSRSTMGIICAHCHTDLPRNLHCCHTCALPLTASQPLCGDCLARPKSYRLTCCPLLYRHPVDHLVLRLKKRDPHTWASALVPILETELSNHYQAESWPNLLVPVPSHPLTRFKRGFNQAHALAHMLGKTTAIPVAPLVARRGKVRQQKTLDRKTRFANLRDAFTCTTHLSGETIAVIDDVITTGATAELMSTCLLKAGAGEVHIWALARTPKPGSR
ncbi:MAG: ComF family protein [Cellvibrionaceae bacterium]|nr:ComF family protein [Cellvibrionaceae bacterium]